MSPHISTLLILACLCGSPAMHAAEWAVTSNLDSGRGSLRAVIAAASPGDRIVFSSRLEGATVLLTSGQLTIDIPLTIDASSLRSGITITRGISSERFRLMEIDDGDDSSRFKVSLLGLRFSNGTARLGGAILNAEDLEMVDCGFAGNRATNLFPDGRGGALLNLPGSRAIMTRVVFEGNRTRNEGGAVSNESAEVRFTDCRFIENASLANAGAVYNRDSSPLFTNCEFLGNEVTAYGGAILNTNAASPTFKNCSFSKNRSSGEVGGGSAIFNLNGSNPTLINCSIAGNEVVDEDIGGTIYSVGSKPYLKNCIFWGNDAGILGEAPDPKSAFNLIQGQPGSRDPHFVRDPGSLDESDFGDLRLLASSPALDAGDGGPGTSVNDLDQDAMGRPRFLGNRIDLGAYEGENILNFAFFHGGLNPEGDENHNGRSNFIDYAIGADPLSPGDSGIAAVELEDQQLRFSYLTDSEDTLPRFERSGNLVDWDPLTPGVDYQSSALDEIGRRTVRTFTLIPSAGPRGKVFYRMRFPDAGS